MVGRGGWRPSFPLTGALVERALAGAREELFGAGQHDNGPKPSPADVSWADALVAMADTSIGGLGRGHRDRHLVLLHLRSDGGGHLHLGPGVPFGIRQYLGCDARVRAVVEAEGKPVSVGRAFRVVPERTRIMIEDRDGGCRVPGCTRDKWLHVHHIRHWEDGGPTDTVNLLALCQHHHRLHHRGGLGIEGNADEPGGVVFRDERGRLLDPCGRPAHRARVRCRLARGALRRTSRWIRGRSISTNRRLLGPAPVRPCCDARRSGGQLAARRARALRSAGPASTPPMSQRTTSDWDRRTESLGDGGNLVAYPAVSHQSGSGRAVSAEVMTVVDAIVDPEREHLLLAGFRQLIDGPTPEGLLRSELLRGQGGAWRIQTTWRDRDALMALRAAGMPPAAVELFDRVGAEQSHGVFTVEASYRP